MRQPYHIKSSQYGVTLAELSIAMTVAILLAAATYRIFMHFQSQSLVQKRIAKIQAGIFPAQMEIEKMVREASNGFQRVNPINPTTDPAGEIRSIDLRPNTSLTGPDSFTVRSNFTGVRSQLRAPLASTLASTDLFLLAGTSKSFLPSHFVVITDEINSEFARVTSIDTATATIKTTNRLYNYSAGATVVLSTRKRIYLKQADSSLYYTSTTALGDVNKTLISRYVTELSFYLEDSTGVLDSVAPFNLEITRFFRYRIKLRIPKQKNLFFERTIAGRVLFRNS